MKICTYLIREILLYLVLFLGPLFLALLGNYVAGFLDKAANGYISLATVGKLVFFISPNLILLILPMAVFGGIFVAFRKLSIQNELIVMFSCGISWKRLFFYASIPVVILTGFTLLLSFIVVPKSLANFEMLTQQAAVKSIKYIIPGKFYNLGKNKELFLSAKRKILFVSLNKNTISLTSSPDYSIKKIEGRNFLIMNNGWKDVLSPSDESIKKLNFEKGVLSLNSKEIAPTLTMAALSTEKLFSEQGLKSEVELRWRIFTGLLPLITLFLVFPFCGGFFKKNSYFNTILAIACFVGFCIVSSLVKNMLTTEELPLWCGFEILSFFVFLNGVVWIVAKDRG